MKARRYSDPRLLLATHNSGKIKEFQRLLAPTGVELDGIDHLPVPEETGTTFLENASIKARAAVAATGRPALADDSGLCAVGLDGRPGVYSADWAGPGKDFTVAMARVRDELASRLGSFAAADRRAYFIAVLVLAWPDGHIESVEGRLEGTLIDPPRGGGGFGYDPMFQPLGQRLTCAEMDPAEKARISHRGRAVQDLIERCWPRSAA